MINISPSIIAADYANLGKEVEDISAAGASSIHFDIMDGNFVPNITFGAEMVSSLRKYSTIPFHVHLMVSSPDNLIKDFISSADLITIHVESLIHADRTLNLIKSYGKKCGISLVPSTPPQALDYLLPIVDQILVMTVNPGFCGQKFIKNQLDKIKIISTKIKELGLDIDLNVDGGINSDNAQDVIASGANSLVAGSYIFSAPSSEYANRIRNLSGNF